MAVESVRVAVLGVGLMGSSHAQRLHERVKGAEVVVVSDFDAARAAEIASRIEGCRSMTDPIAAMEQDDVDAILIATPAASHAELTIAAIERGIPVFCEKPLGETVDAARRVVAAERATGRRMVQLGFMRRYDGEYAEMRQRIASGEIGDPLVVSTTVRTHSVPESFTTDMILSDSAAHDFDMARFLLGDDIESVEVVSPKASRHCHEGLSSPQIIIARMRGGAVLVLSIHLVSGMAYETRTEVLGSDGALEMGFEGGLQKRTTSGAREWHVAADFIERFENAYIAELQDFVRGVREGDIRGPSTEDGLVADLACAAGIVALERGTRIAVDDTGVDAA